MTPREALEVWSVLVAAVTTLNDLSPSAKEREEQLTELKQFLLEEAHIYHAQVESVMKNL